MNTKLFKNQNHSTANGIFGIIWQSFGWPVNSDWNLCIASKPRVVVHSLCGAKQITSFPFELNASNAHIAIPNRITQSALCFNGDQIYEPHIVSEIEWKQRQIVWTSAYVCVCIYQWCFNTSHNIRAHICRFYVYSRLDTQPQLHRYRFVGLLPFTHIDSPLFIYFNSYRRASTIRQYNRYTCSGSPFSLRRCTLHTTIVVDAIVCAFSISISRCSGAHSTVLLSIKLNRKISSASATGDFKLVSYMCPRARCEHTHTHTHTQSDSVLKTEIEFGWMLTVFRATNKQTKEYIRCTTFFGAKYFIVQNRTNSIRVISLYRDNADTWNLILKRNKKKRIFFSFSRENNVHCGNTLWTVKWRNMRAGCLCENQK